MRLRIWISTLLGCLVLPAAAPPVAAQPEDVGRWEAVREQARKGWATLRRAAERGGLRATYQYRRSATVAGKPMPSLSLDFEFATNGVDMFLRKGADGESKVRGANVDYAFDIWRGAPGSQYELGDLRRGALQVRMKDQLAGIWQPFMYAGFQVAGTDFSEIAGREAFRVLSFRTDEAGKTATMTFEDPSAPATLADGTTGGEKVPSGGTITFATDKLWAIRDYHCITSTGRIEAQVRCRPFEGAFIPESYQSRTSAGDQVGEESYELKTIEKVAYRAALPVRLKDYGLPEPKAELARAGGGGGWVVLLNVAMMSLLLGAVYLVRRRKTVPI